MNPQSQLSTRSSNEEHKRELDEEFLSEDSESVHSFALRRDTEKRNNTYISTNIVT